MASCSSSFLPGTSQGVWDRQHRAEAGPLSELGLNEPIWGTRSQQWAEFLNQGSCQYAKKGAAKAEEERGDQGCVITPSGHLFILHPTAKGKQPHPFLS